MTRARDIASGLGEESGEVVPHIKLDTLYPAVAGKLLDGSTSHSGDYGTAQSDGRKYYYTNIAGSKPIKDPRIGAYFGSQRHKFKSLQLLEQETATNGTNVYSVDGREWCRLSGTFVLQNNDQGNVPYLNSANSFIEITGYFSEANLISLTYSSGRDYKWKIDGGGLTTKTTFNTSSNSPLAGRYVDAGSVANIGISQTLGIHTLKLEVDASEDTYMYGIELIVQDTTDTASKSKIQIPAQTVISYGKKHSISATAQHYDPFNGFTSGSDISGYIDEATSLGMSNWKVYSTWYKGFNGGRVVKWIDSSGNIKTSVTMMPPNGQNMSTTASNAIDLSSSQTNNDIINFNTSAIDHSLSEVAKTFNWRELGNGAANTGGGGSWADASMLSSVDDISYVMDDGLTSLIGDSSVANHYPIGYINDNGSAWWFTFIGTGFTLTGRNPSNDESNPVNVVNNLPYGTHVVKIGSKSGAHIQTEISVDGVEVYPAASGLLEYGGIVNLTIHQPKMPPIPDEAVIIADYMLMADFVAFTHNSNQGYDRVCKGTRHVSASRDIFVDETEGGLSFNLAQTMPWAVGGFQLQVGGAITDTNCLSVKYKLPAFATNFVARGYDPNGRLKLHWGDNSFVTQTALGNADGAGVHPASGQTLGLLTLSANGVNGNNGQIAGIEVVTPIHTSSHYSEFETPYLKELVGGDRNMEQTNLIVSPSGETWDEVTRDTSYLGLMKTMGALETNQDTANTIIIPTEWRGSATVSTDNPMFNKDFAIAYDRLICLEDGQYNITFNQFTNDSLSAWSYQKILINGTTRALSIASDADWYGANISGNFHLKRGDYVQISGIGHTNEMIYQINRI